MNSITRTVLVLTTDAGLSAQVAAFFSDRYRVVTSLAEAEKPDAAVCEAALLAAQDFALLKRLLAQDGGCAVFLLGEAEEAELERAFALGLEDVIAAPFSATTAKMRMARALARRRSGSADPLRIAEAIIALDKSMIEALAAAIEFRSRESGDHVRRIHDITAHLLGETPLGRGYSAREIEEIALASILHDVGKIAVPDQVLNKPGKLNDEEFAIMRSHTVQGEALLAQIPLLQAHASSRFAMDIARHHHERWDGSGYPDGLRGDAISLPAQIVGLADVYDALRSPRVYKPAFSRAESLRMIRQGDCGAFNPALLDVFLSAEPSIAAFYE